MNKTMELSSLFDVWSSSLKIMQDCFIPNLFKKKKPMVAY